MPTIVTLGLLAQPGEEGLAVGSKSMSRRWDAHSTSSHSGPYLSRCRSNVSQYMHQQAAMTKLRAFVEASKPLADTRGRHRHAGSGIRTSVAILLELIGG